MTHSVSVTASPAAGPLIGSQSDDGVLRFAGVRYGSAQRFQRPTRLTPHSRAVDARNPGPICPQMPSRLEAVMGPQPGEPAQSEDCLYLAVATPGLDGERPVMVWLHGGAFVTGAGTLAWYDGGRLAADGDVVVVSVNYRLGALGYLVHENVSEGNLGLYDQILALEWVRDNIAAFGGDPTNITVFGQSAGGLSTLALLSIPGSRALIRRAVVQSAPGLSTIQSSEEALEVGRYFARTVGQDPATAPVGQLLRAQQETLRWNAAKDPKSPLIMTFGPVRDHPLSPVYMSDTTLRSDPMPELMIGHTTDEGFAFAAGPQDAEMRDALRYLTQRMFVDPSHDLARSYANAGGTVYSYEFSWTPSNGGLGAVHCLELPFLLGTPESWRDSPMLGDTRWAEVESLGKDLRQRWTQFARSGSITIDQVPLPQWGALSKLASAHQRNAPPL
jgi:para-nitrobenzyl esterase